MVDQRAVAEAISRSIDGVDGLESAGHVGAAAECLAALARASPDAVVVGAPLLDADAMTLAARVLEHRADMAVVVFSGSANHSVVERAAEARVAAVVAKWSPLSVLVDTLNGKRTGSPWIDPAIADLRREHQLTPREHDVLRLLGDGRAPQEIARSLGITLNTTRGHVKAVLAKLEAHSVLQAVLTAQQRGLL